MITNCPVCGKAFDVLWPQLWAYRDGSLYFCTWKCLRQMRKEAEEMYTKTKKDGTPAKRPGPRPKKITDPDVEVKLPEPDREKFEKQSITHRMQEDIKEAMRKACPPVMTPEEREEIRQEIAAQEKRAVEKENSRPLEAAALKSRILTASWKYQDGHVFLEGPDLSMSTIALTAKEWIALTYEIRTAIRQLGLTGE